MTKNIYVIRHCSATGQADESPLTAEGSRQTEALSAFLEGRNIEHVYSSPSRRALDTILPFASRNSVAVRTDSRLRERILSTEPLDNWMECLEQSFNDRALKFNGGESAIEAAQRSYEVVKGILDDKYSTVALVTHGNLMALLLGLFDSSIGYSEWSRLSNPDVYLISAHDSSFEVKRVWEG